MARGLAVALVLLAVSLPAIAGGDDGPAPAHGTPTFLDVAPASGISGGGSFFSWGDYDDDGDDDLLVDGGRLFRNGGGPAWAFTEVTAAAGIVGGGNGNWADYDGDGFLDFYQVGPNRLWRNNQNGTFTDVTAGAGDPTSSDPTGAVAWGDYDRDGDVDLFIAGSEGAVGVYYPDHLYRNDGGTFTEVTATALGSAETNSPKYGRGATWADYNEDGWPDLYVTNYRQQPNYLYRNDGDGTFTNLAPSLGLHNAPVDAVNNPDPCNRAGHGVGSSFADYDNDGDLDLLVGTFNHKDWRTSDDTQLWRSMGSPGFTFQNVRAAAGIPVKSPDLRSPPHPYCGSSDGSIWTGPQGDELIVGATWGDVDNDGDLDLWMPQIYDLNYAYSYLYSNDGDGTFTDIAATAGVRVYDTYGGAFSDYDQDGDLDLVTGGRLSGGTGAASAIRLFRNNGVAGHDWLEVRVGSCGGDVNTAGIGTRVEFRGSGLSLVRTVEAGQSSHSQQNSLVAHFGLGHFPFPSADVRLELPTGSAVPVNLTVNTIHTVDVNCPLEPVQNPRADLTGPSLQDVTLSWDPPAAGEGPVLAYEIRFATVYEANGTGYALLATLPKGGRSYVHVNAGKGDGATYFYRLLVNGTSGTVAYPKQLAKFAATLAPGTHFLGLPIAPFDPAPVNVLASLAGEFEMVRSFNASDAADLWKSRRGAGPDFDLAELRIGQGFWVRLTTAFFTGFAVTGFVEPSTRLQLRVGWNMVGYASFNPLPVATALAGIPVTAVEGFDANTGPYSLRRMAGSDLMVPGRGYWVHVTADAAWTVTV